VQPRGGKPKSVYRCQCDCGKTVDVIGALLGKHVKSCGCLNMDNLVRPIPIGTRYSRLEVIKDLGVTTGKGKIYLCKCDCGNEIMSDGDHLKQGFKKSCGCLHSEQAKERGCRALKAMLVQGTNIRRITCKKPPSNNNSGVRGVHWRPDKERWIATIGFQGKRYYLGSFEELKDAKDTRKVAEEKLHDAFVKAWKDGASTQGHSYDNKESDGNG